MADPESREANTTPRRTPRVKMTVSITRNENELTGTQHYATKN